MTRKETHCCHMGYSFQLAARFFYMHHPRQDSTYHGLCYTSLGALAETRNLLITTIIYQANSLWSWDTVLKKTQTSHNRVSISPSFESLSFTDNIQVKTRQNNYAHIRIMYGVGVFNHFNEMPVGIYIQDTGN